MRRPFKKAADLVFQNFGWKVLSLGAAVVIWALVASEPEVTTFTSVRPEYVHMPADLEIGAEPVSTVMLELQGPSAELRGVGDGLRAAVVIDAGGVGPGLHTFTISDRNLRGTRRVRLVRANPPDVSLYFEPHAERTVPVEVRWSGPRAAQYRVQPSRIGIQGPSSHVARVMAAITDPVDLSRMAGSAARLNLSIVPEDSFVRFKSAAQVTLEIGK
ncbi:MAG TPA: hypothetical protein VKE70_14765 [Candidatus Solibacter sp.]|nr:hypothetical protein [Candidatus Solibacter sp.]